MKIQSFCYKRAFGSAQLIVLVAAMLLTSAATSRATPLLPGNILFPAPAGPINGGTLFNVPQVVPFVSPTYTGTLTSEVFQNDPTNPFLGGLTFVYQISNTSSFPGEIDRLTVSSFSGFATDAIYVAGSASLAPTYIDRSSGPAGATVGFSFAQPPLGSGSIQPGQTSDLLVVYTDAKSAAFTLASTIDGSVAQVLSYAPTTNLIPEPSTFVLAGLATIGLVAFGRRRR
jgi:PEP-CTERM motif